MRLLLYFLVLTSMTYAGDKVEPLPEAYVKFMWVINDFYNHQNGTVSVLDERPIILLEGSFVSNVNLENFVAYPLPKYNITFNNQNYTAYFVETHSSLLWKDPTFSELRAEQRLIVSKMRLQLNAYSIMNIADMNHPEDFHEIHTQGNYNYMAIPIKPELYENFRGNRNFILRIKRTPFLSDDHIYTMIKGLRYNLEVPQYIDFGFKDKQAYIQHSSVNQVYGTILNLFQENNKNSYAEFLNRMLGLVTNKGKDYLSYTGDTFHKTSRAHLFLRSLREYEEGLDQNEPKRLLVGRGRLNARSDGIPLFSDYALSPDYRPYTIDIDPEIFPDMIADITNRKEMQNIPEGFFDEIFFDGLTYPALWENPSLAENIKHILKPGGVLIINGKYSFQHLYDLGFTETSSDDFKRLEGANQQEWEYLKLKII